MSTDRSDDPDSLQIVPPYLSVEMSRAGGEWDAASEEVVLRVAQLVFEQVGDRPAAEVSILLADNAFVQSLNRKFRGQDKPTNVLSFPHAPTPADAFYDEPSSLGDIALASETLREEAEAQNKSFDDHLAHLVVHGVLHLLGYDHLADADAETMEAKERELLGRIGIKDPYAERRMEDKA